MTFILQSYDSDLRSTSLAMKQKHLRHSGTRHTGRAGQQADTDIQSAVGIQNAWYIASTID